MVSCSIGVTALVAIISLAASTDAGNLREEKRQQPLRKLQSNSVPGSDYVARPSSADPNSLWDAGEYLLIGSLGLCEGDCDSDTDCSGDLACYWRNDATPVPGCSGEGISGNDYCFERPTPNSVYNKANNLTPRSYGLCEGDCDSDDDCTGNLICEQRDGFARVPGCTGFGERDIDYCRPPDTESPTPNPNTESPSASPITGPLSKATAITESPTPSDVKYFDSGTWSGSLLSISDVGIENPNNLLMAVKLTNEESDYYVGFNGDEVTIIDFQDGQASLHGVLVAGQSKTFSNWRGSGEDLTVTVNDIVTDASPGYANVEIVLEEPASVLPTTSPSASPTKIPTISPSKNPTTSPSKNPTSTPSKNPTISPSASPTKIPTTSPSKNPTSTPSKNPTRSPSASPTKIPTTSSSKNPTTSPSKNPTSTPSKNPTISPSASLTLSCGNSMCEPGENPNTCPSDCVSKSFGTGMQTDAVTDGLMFTIKATSADATITSFDIYLRGKRNAEDQIFVFTRSGGYQGLEENEEEWKRIVNKEVQPPQGGPSNVVLGEEVTIPAGSKQAFYIWSNAGGLQYRKTRGNNQASDGSLVIESGVTTKKMFEKVERAGMYTGGVRYYETASSSENV